MKKLLCVILSCITVICVGAFAACSNNVQEEKANFSLNVYLLTINVGDTYDIDVEGTTENAQYVSTNTSIADVDENGVITAKYIGYTNIIVTINGVDQICSVEVVENPASLLLDKSGTKELVIGDELTVTASLKIGGVDLTEQVEWTLSNEKCTFEINGNEITLKAVEVGEIVLQAQYKDVSASTLFIIRSSQSTILAQPEILSANCVSIEWEAVDGAVAYAVKVGNGAWQRVDKTSYNYPNELNLDGGIISVRALAENATNYFDGMPMHYAVDHTFEENGYESGNAPTCYKTEELIYQCQYCTANYTKEVYGHKFGKGEGNCSLCDGERVTEGLTFKLNDDGAGYTLNGYNGSDKEIYVPSTYNGLPVVSVASGTVFGDVKPTTIYLHGELIGYEDVIRTNNANLEKLVYYGTTINKNLFVSISAIKTVILPNMTEIPVNRIADNPAPTKQLTKLVVTPKVNIGVYSVCSGSVDLYVLGSETEDQITVGVGNGGLTGKKYYYDENAPTGCDKNTWRWVDGEPTAWQAKHEYVFGTCSVCGNEIHTDGLKIVTNANWCNIQSYTGTSTEVYIPSTYNNKKVYYADAGTEFNGKGVTLIRFGTGFHCGMSKTLMGSCGNTLQTVIWMDSVMEKYQFNNKVANTVIMPNVTEIITGGFNDSTGTIALRKLVVNAKVDIKAYAVRSGEGLVDLYSLGSVEETDITIGIYNEGLSKKIFYYSETKPTDTTSTYWRFVDGVPMVWEKA